MPNTIQDTHKGVIIAYNESRNRWEFALRGRDRSSDSLASAREMIDKPAPKEAKPFARIPAWEVRHGGTPSHVEITGIAESGFRSSGVYVWIKDANGSRRKEDAEIRLYPSCEHNDAICAEIIKHRKEMDELGKKCETLRNKLQPLKLEVPQ